MDGTELTNWPRKSGIYKVVQMDIEGKPCIRFPDHTFSHNFVIIEIAGKLQQKFPIIKDYRGSDAPALE